MCESWPSIGTSTVPASDTSRAGPLEIVSVRVPAGGRGERPDLEPRARIERSLERAQGGHDEQQRSHKRRHGVPGQPEDERGTSCGERDRLAGTHRHAPEDLLGAELGERAADEIVRADRDTAGRDQHVRLEPALECGTVRRRLVGHRRARPDLGSRGAEHGGQHDAVRLVDLSVGERLAR